MNTKTLEDWYFNSEEIIELMKILIFYLEKYSEEIPETYTSNILAKIILERCEALAVNIDKAACKI